MDKKVLNYRKKHKKCKYCKYYHIGGNSSLGLFYNECKAKDTIICSIDFPKPFCSCYEVKDEL